MQSKGNDKCSANLCVGSQSKADTLDIVTQFISLSSIMLAGYVHVSKHIYGSEGTQGKAVATVMFVASNLMLLVVHMALIAVPLRAKIKAKFHAAAVFCRSKLQGADGEDANLGGVDVLFELKESELQSNSLCEDELSERGPVEVLFKVDNTIELQTNPVACHALGGDCGQTQSDDESVAPSRAESVTMRAEKDAAQESTSVTSV